MWPGETIMRGGRGLVSREDRRGSWRDRRRTGRDYVSERTATANHQSSFGPTYRLVSSPEVGPGATVGTLKQGYPLPQYEGTTPTERYLVARRTVLNRATSIAPGLPRG